MKIAKISAHFTIFHTYQDKHLILYSFPTCSTNVQVLIAPKVPVFKLHNATYNICVTTTTKLHKKGFEKYINFPVFCKRLLCRFTVFMSSFNNGHTNVMASLTGTKLVQLYIPIQCVYSIFMSFLPTFFLSEMQKKMRWILAVAN